MSVLINLPGGGTIRPAGLNIGGRVTEVTLNDTTWVALPSTPLAQRNALAIQNVSGVEMKVNYSSGIAGYEGIVIADGNERSYQISDTIIVYGKSALGSITVNVEELA